MEEIVHPSHTPTRRTALTFCASAAAQPLFLIATSGSAQDYPSKPVKVIVPYPPGGGADTVSRILFTRLSEAFGQQFVIDNRAGAGRTIGAAVAAKAERDGYTILYDSTESSRNPPPSPPLT